MSRAICRRHFKNLGYIWKRRKRIINYIDYEFDIYEKGAEVLALYVLEKENFLPSVVDATTVILGKNSSYKICICIPESFAVPLDSHKKAVDSNVEIYAIKGNHVYLSTSGLSKKELDKLSIEEVEETLKNINRISKNKFGLAIFKIKQDLIKKLKLSARDESAFIYQITTISSIVESIDAVKLRGFINPTTSSEVEIFKQNHSISIIELFLKRNNVKFDTSMIKDLRDLRKLRNMTPVHPSSGYKEICIKYLGRIPKSEGDWLELSDIAFKKFKGTFMHLRDVLK